MSKFKIVIVITLILSVIFTSNTYAAEIKKYNETIDTATTEILGKVEELKTKSTELFSNLTDVNKGLNSVNAVTSPFGIIGIFLKAVILVILINVFAKLFVKVFFNYGEIVKSRKQSRHLSKVLKDIYD